jgi:virginiamycin B lyase
VTSYTGTGISRPEGITAGPDGKLWFANNGNNSIGRITTTGTVTKCPPASGISQPGLITAGPDGAVWFGNSGNNSIGRITTTCAVTTYCSGFSFPNTIAAGPDGSVWAINYTGLICKISTTAPVTVTRYTSVGDNTYGIAAGPPDGAMWFCNAVPNGSIGRINYNGHVTSTYPSGVGHIPWSITAGPDGAMWFALSNEGGGIGRVTTSVTP